MDIQEENMSKLIKCSVIVAMFAITLSIYMTYAQSTSSYDPTRYGIPTQIAGYTVLGVQTIENTPCMPYGTAQLVLKTSQPNVKSFLRNVLIDTVQQALAKLTEKANFKWGFVFVGPKATREQIWAENEKRNEKLGMLIV